MKLARSFLPLTFPIFQPTHMAYTIYFSSHLTTLSSSSHFQTSHVSSIFSGSGALFSLFSRLFPLLLLLYFLSLTPALLDAFISFFFLFSSLFHPLFFFFSDSLLQFFFFKILIQNLFGIQILRVFLILLEGVPIFFFKGKQIKKFKLLYINFFFQVRVFRTPWTLSGVATRKY